MKNEFLNEICCYIPYKKLHTSIKEEFSSHIDELAEGKMFEGASEKEAYEYAIKQMGSPKDIGLHLKDVYKPKTNWSWMFGLIFIGLFSLFSIAIVEEKVKYFENPNFMQKSILYSLLGFILMVLLMFIDLSKIKKYSYYLYFIPLFIMWISGIYLFWVQDVGYPDYEAFYYRLFFHYLMIPLTIGLIGIFEKNKKSLTCISLYLLAPIISTLIFAKTFNYTGECILLFILFVAFSNYSKMKKIGIYAGMFLSAISLSVFAFIIEPYRVQRFYYFLHPYDDPNGSGYHQVASLEMLKNSNIFGKGNKNDYAEFFPEPLTQGILPIISFEFGYGFAILILLLLFSLLFNIFKKIKYYNNPYLQMVGLGSLLFVLSPAIINVAMHFSLFPMGNVHLPFVSYMGYHTWFYFIAIGLVFNIERKKQFYKLCY